MRYIFTSRLMASFPGYTIVSAAKSQTHYTTTTTGHFVAKPQLAICPVDSYSCRLLVLFSLQFSLDFMLDLDRFYTFEFILNLSS